MKRQFALYSLLLIFFASLFFPQKATAAYGSVTVTASISGQTITVNVGVSPATEMEIFDCTLSYRANVVEFVSGTSSIGAAINDGSGIIYIARNLGSSFTAGHIATLTFKTKGSGNADFTSSDGSGSHTYNGDYTFSGSSASVNIQNAPAVTPTNTVANTAPPQTPLTTIETLPATTTDTTQTEETKSEPTKAFKAADHRGRSLSISEIALEEADIPSGFEAAERMIDGSAMSGYYSENEDLFLALLSLSGQDPQLYFYNDSSDSFIPYLRFKLGEEYYHVTLMPDDLIPYGTSRSDADIKDVNLPVIEFNFGEYIPFDDYMKQYQAQSSKPAGASASEGQTGSTVSDNVTTMDIEIDSVNEATYLLALEGKNKDIERFIYSQSLDQLMHYDLLLVPAFGTFLDKDFDNLAKEDPKGPELQTEPVSAATEALVGDLNEGTDKVQSRTVSLFGRDFELWHIIAAAGGVLLILIILIIIIIKFNSDRKRAEFPFADEFLSDDFMYRSGEDTLDEQDDSDAENFRPVDYNYPNDFPEVRDISDISAKAEQSFSKEYQTTSSEGFDPEDQEEI
ncbi:MAG: hypothetical protein GX763_09885 [Clostridiaceae bacterium]|nr:hypothetical protein [Clostridiaceae bacterium]